LKFNPHGEVIEFEFFFEALRTKKNNGKYVDKLC